VIDERPASTARSPPLRILIPTYIAEDTISNLELKRRTLPTGSLLTHEAG